jgi:hypothetical protein
MDSHERGTHVWSHVIGMRVKYLKHNSEISENVLPYGKQSDVSVAIV